MEREDSKYRFLQYTRADGARVVVAITSFAGKTVKGMAVCSPHDEFDFEIGKRLAKLRAEKKLAWKRADKAGAKLNEISDELTKLANQYAFAREYYSKCHRELMNMENQVISYEGRL